MSKHTDLAWQKLYGGSYYHGGAQEKQQQWLISIFKKPLVCAFMHSSFNTFPSSSRRNIFHPKMIL